MVCKYLYKLLFSVDQAAPATEVAQPLLAPTRSQDGVVRPGCRAIVERDFKGDYLGFERGDVLFVESMIEGSGSACVLSYRHAEEDYISKQSFHNLKCEAAELKWGTETVPAWAYEPHAFYKFRPYMPVASCGPAMLWGFKAAIASFAMWAAAPVIAYMVQTCQGAAVPSVPKLLYMLCSVLIFYLIWLEYQVQRYTLVYQILLTASKEGFKVCGRELPFMVWYVAVKALSLAAHADLFTSGFFAARVVGADQCSDQMSRSWAHAMMSSLLGREIPFFAFALMGWIFIGFQFVFAYCLSAPKRAFHPFSFEQKEMHYNLQFGDNDLVHFDTHLTKGSNTHQAVKVLAECGRMTAVTFQETTVMKCEWMFAPKCSIEAMSLEFKRLTLRFLLFGLLENAFQLNLQASGLALMKAVKVVNSSHIAPNIDPLTLTSIALGLLMALWNFCQYVSEARWIVNLCLGTTMEQLEQSEKQKFQADIDSQTRENIKSSIRSVLCWRFPFYMIALIYVLLVFRAAYQTVAAIVCPMGLHNIGQGCVTF